MGVGGCIGCEIVIYLVSCGYDIVVYYVLFEVGVLEMVDLIKV